MARKMLVALDLTQRELQNARMQNLATAPSSPVVGQLYFDTAVTPPVLRVWDGSAWLTAALGAGTVTSSHITDGTIVNGDINAGAAIALSKLATDPLARANHTGTQAASTISDFDTQVRTSRLDQMAAPTASVGYNSQKITGLADGTAATDAATKGQLDAAVNGLDWKASVRAATTANITLSGTQTVDGVALIAGNRVLVKDQSTGANNGIYVVAAGAWSRATDADASAEVTSGMAVFVEEGTANGNQQWVLTTDNPITLGTTALVFAQVGGSGSAPTAGGGLTLASNTYAVGAGTGITVNADDVAIDTAVVVRKYAVAIGDGAATSFTVTHSLGTQDVTVSVYAAGSPYAEVECDIEHTSTTTITVRFDVAPTSGQYRVVVHG